MLHYTTLHIHASTNLPFMWLLVILPIPFHYILNAIYVIHIWRIPWPFQDRPLFINEDYSTFRVIAWQEIMPKSYSFCGNTAHLQSVFQSHNNRQHCRVWRKQNESCYVDSDVCKLASKCASFGICTAAEAYLF